MTTQDVLNLTFLRRLTSGNCELERTLFELYHATASNCLRRIKMGDADITSKDWLEAIHMLKGASANIGANEMLKLCTEAELLEEEDNTQRPDYVTRIEEAYARLSEAIRTLHQ